MSEMFCSLQGEGLTAGLPAAFLRLGNCNLSCGYCDTAYTWDDSRFDLTQELSQLPLSQVIDWVCEHAPGRLIITGGEPLIQQSLLSLLLAQIDQAFEARDRPRLVVEVETNGTILPPLPLAQRIDHWNVSPKLSNSGQAASAREKEAVLRGLAALPQAVFKFVVRDAADVEEAAELGRRLDIAPHRLLLMPEAQTPEQLRQRAPAVAEWAYKKRLRYSGRLHLELYGGRRGA